MSLYFTLKSPDEEGDELFSINITHNLAKMADEAGIYEVLWRPDEIGVTAASQIVLPLSEGIVKLAKDPEHFKQFNPSNGWGSYAGLLSDACDILKACATNPDAKVSVWA